LRQQVGAGRGAERILMLKLRDHQIEKIRRLRLAAAALGAVAPRTEVLTAGLKPVESWLPCRFIGRDKKREMNNLLR